MPNSWQKLTTTPLATRARLTLHSDETLAPDGTPTTYDWIEIPDTVRIAATDNTHIWIVSQHHYLPGKRLWQLPGGGIDPNETPEDAAHRELKEETGLTATTLRHAGTIWSLPGFTPARTHFWIATGITQHQPELEPYEADLTAFPVPLAEARNAVLDGRIGCAPSAQLIWTTLDHLRKEAT